MAILRITSTVSFKVVPYAVRAICSRGSITNAINGCDQNSSIAISHHQFSSDAKKQSDGKLAKIIKTEIKLEKMSLEKDMHTIPNEFPFIIEMEDPWEDHLTMSRVFCGEKIHVIIREPRFNFDKENKSPHNLADYRANSTWTRPLEFIVKVSKENGKILEFQVTVYADKIKVDSVLVKEPAPQSGHPLQTFELNFMKKEGELQIGLREYLEIRGIKKSYHEFLCEKMVKKYKSRPMVGLKTLRDFIKE